MASEKRSRLGSGGDPLVGREALMESILGALEQAGRGFRQVLLLTGEPGIGKSRCLREVEARARERGQRVRVGRCVEGEGAPPYWPWVQVLRGRGDGGPGSGPSGLGTGGEALSRLLEGAEDRSTEPSPAERFRLFDTATRFLTGAGEGEALVVLLDDLHRADASSILLLRHLVRESTKAKLLLIGTYRDNEVGPEHPLARALADVHSEHRVVRLPRLDGGEVRDIAEWAAGHAVSAEVVAMLHGRTEGNPLFVSEMVRLLAGEGRLERGAEALRSPIAIPDTVRGVIRQRLATLSAKTVEALSLSAVVGREFTSDVLDRAASGPESSLHALDEATRAHLVSPDDDEPSAFRFSHDLVREVLYDQIPLDRRAHLHGHVADAIESVYAADLTPHLAALAHHLLEAAPLRGAAPAVDFAERAGSEARRKLAHEESAQQFESALRALDRVEESDDTRAVRRTRLLVDLGDARWAAGDQQRAREAFLEAAEGARRLEDPELLGRAAFGFAGRTDVALDVEATSVSLLEEALGTLGPIDRPLTSRLMARLATAVYFGPDRAYASRLAREALAMAERVGDPGPIVYALAGLCYVLRRPGHAPLLPIAERIVAMSRAGGFRDYEATGHYEQLLDFLERGDLPGADLAIAELGRLADDLHEPWFRWLATGYRAMRALLSGEFDRAEGLIGEGFDIGATFDTPNTLAFFGGTLFYLRRERGGLATLEDTLRSLMLENPRQRVFRLAVAHVAQEQGRHEEARALYEPIAAAGFDALPPNLMWSASVFLCVDLALALGDERGAAELERVLAACVTPCHVGPFGTAWLGSKSLPLGRLASALGRADDAVAHLETALDIHRRAGARPLVARTLAALAGALRQRGHAGDAERARAAVVESTVLTRDLGMEPLRAELESLPRGGSGAHAATSPTRGHLQHRGDGWEVSFAGRRALLPDSKGLRDVVLLLATPGREVHVSDLVLSAEGVPGLPTKIDAEDVALGHLTVRRNDPGSERLDERARTAYQERLRELRADLDEANEWNDRGRVDLLTEEIGAIEAELSRFGGPRARRRPSADVERARKAVTKRITSAIERVERDHPEFGRHLRKSVRTGTFCAYEPEHPIEWQLADARPQAK